MRYFTALLATLVLAACSTTSITRNDAQAATPAVVEFLLTSAASDFHTHSPVPARFRNVRIGHVKNPSGEDQYLLCGEFFLPAQEASNAEWTPFVTIQTSGYEQYIGGLAEANYCRHSSVIWDEEDDLSSSLQSQFDSLR
jgi:hypothetical protein